MNERIGLAIVDVQTLHYGHLRLLNHMSCTVDRAIIGLGSMTRYNMHGHPFTPDQRRRMVKQVFGSRFEFVHLDDIDSDPSSSEWVDYVLAKIKSSHDCVPTDYFSGSFDDAKWYSWFGNVSSVPFVTAVSSIYSVNDRRLHIIDRHDSNLLSGRVIREMIENRNDDWKLHVPERLHAFVDENYPGHLRVPLTGSGFPEESSTPVGTLFFFEGKPDDVYELKDDRKWRRRVVGDDEKTIYAKQRKVSLKEGA